MRSRTAWLALALTIAVAPSPAAVSAAPSSAPPGWVDAKTGHRVLRLSTAPGNYALYFNYNAYTPNGDTMIFQTADGISAVDMKSWTVRTVLHRPGLRLLFAGHKTRSAYFSERPAGDSAGPVTLYAADIDSGAVRRIAQVPRGSQIDTINADETLLGGQVAARDMPLQPGAGPDAHTGLTPFAANGPDGKPLSYADAKEYRLNARLEARIPMEIYTVDIRSGARRVLVQSTDWLNHLQFSPTDPTLLMYCHEGPWNKVDRIWTVRTDGSDNRKIHVRTMAMEVAGHEFWSPDGKTIWYDLQTPRGEVFWLAGYDVATGKRRWYHVERDQWSVHYNVSGDQRLFSGDGSDPEMVARARDAKWLYLFRPRAIPAIAGIRAPESAALIAPATLDQEKLVDLSRQDYRLEPNARFSPDGKWLIFRANIEGSTGIYAVEVARRAP